MQAFVQEDRHTIQPAVAKKLQVLPTDIYPSVFHRELQTELRPFATITDGYTDGYTDGPIPVGISQRVEKNYGILPQLLTVLPTDMP
jgi:hypothetical protein